MTVLSTSQTEPRWGSKNRDLKAYTILQAISHFVLTPLTQTTWLDIGCGSGGIAMNIAPHVKSIVGVDPEPWARWSDIQSRYKNVHFLNESVANLSLQDTSVDIIICNQVYEHVPDPKHLIAEIYRILKPGGYCYFAGPNLLFPIEPHIFWPLVHWLPRQTAIKLIRFFNSKAILDAYSTDYWTLTRWLHRFEINNMVPDIIKNPVKYGKKAWWWRMISYTPRSVLQTLTWLSPGFVFVIRKPLNSGSIL